MSHKEDDSCGPKFRTGSTYILYVPESRVVSDCSGTQLVITNIVRKSGIERLNHLRAN